MPSKRLKYIQNLLGCLVGVVGFADVALAQSVPSAPVKDMVASCRTIEIELRVDCDVRLLDPRIAPGGPRGFKIVMGGQEVRSTAFEPYLQAGGKKADGQARVTAWLILIDRSKSVSKNLRDLIVNDFRRVVGSPDTADKPRDVLLTSRDLTSQRAIGIATFAEDFRMPARIGSAPATLSEQLALIRSDGTKTFMSRAIIQGIDALREYPADRRALVVVTDGLEEDTSYTPVDVISRARAAGVVVYGIGYSDKDQQTDALRTLERIARETDGPYVQAELQNKIVLSGGLAQEFYGFMESGGTVSFEIDRNMIPAAGQNEMVFDIRAELAGGDFLTRRVTSPIDREYAWAVVRFLDRVAGKENRNYVIAAAAALLLLLLGVIAWLLLRSPAEADGGVYATADGAPFDSDYSGYGQTGQAQPLPPYSGGQVGTMDDRGTAGMGTRGDMDTRKVGVSPNGALSSAHGWLEVLDGSNRRIAIDKTLMGVGRHEDCEIRLDHATVHRRHAVISLTKEGVAEIRDLSGPGGNKVFVGGKAVTQALLRDGDEILLGDLKLRFVARTV